MPILFQDRRREGNGAMKNTANAENADSAMFASRTVSRRVRGCQVAQAGGVSYSELWIQTLRFALQDGSVSNPYSRPRRPKQT